MTLLTNGLFEQCFLVSFLILISGSCGLLGNEMDKSVLLDIKRYLASGGGLRSWNESSHFCLWQGVVCGEGKIRQRVISLKLHSQGLAGSLPPSIGNLTFLTSIGFGSNKLVGSIPKELGFLPQLRSLNLSDNLLNGHIPVELMNCSELRMLQLSLNNLTGSIPFEIGYLSKLSFLALESNKLSGTIPPSIGHLSELEELWLMRNSLAGTLTSAIGNLSSLEVLSLVSNLIEGEIPSTISKLQKLKTLHLSFNCLSGTIPASLYNISSLIDISLAKNYLHGDFMPNSKLNVPRLIYLVFGYNHFSGSIPVALLNITTLEYFDAPFNNLTGQIPSNLGVLRNLRWFNVDFNELGSGTSLDLEFLTSLSNASALSVLSLTSNRIGGEFPASFLNHSTGIKTLILSRNQISGRLPEGIGKQIYLKVLGLENNNLEGVIPESMGNLKMLEKIHLHENRLTGHIPDSLGNLTSLFFLSLADNSLEGRIPSSLKQCEHLQDLYLYQNKLSGEIPGDFLNHFPQLTFLDLAQNLLNGSVPSEIGQLKNLGVLVLYNNRLSGQIPEELGESVGLEFLVISENYLEGSIPSSLGKLRALQVFELANNTLSGSIPTSLENLNVLWSLNLSYNNLEGQVPRGGVFNNFSALSLTGNSKLCGGITELHLSRCPRRPRKIHLTVVVILVVIACIGLLAFILACSVLYWRKTVKRFFVYHGLRRPVSVFDRMLSKKENKKEKRNASSMAFPEGIGVLRVTYQDLHNATSGFDPSNLIGAGSFGSVYKGILSNEQKPIAVKVLNLEQHGALKTFQAECSSLGTVRHRNLLKILTTCSSVDNKGNDFLALVFELMPNGSLENWLHESRSLLLSQKIDIAIDIALALDYLHSGCKESIIHCDLKPSNILLDQDMVVHVADFGLAKILSTEQNRDRSSTYALKGSIGYIPPEYGLGAKASPQGDVYSFGILLLEMITGMRPTSHIFTDGIDIREYVKRALPDHVLEISDSISLIELEGRNNDGRKGMKIEEILVSTLEIGIACSSVKPSERMDTQDMINSLLVLKSKLIEMDACVSKYSPKRDKYGSTSKP